MTENDLRLSGAYATDAVSDEEREAFEPQLADDPYLQEETDSLRNAAHELTHISATAPPARLRADVLAAIKTVRPLPPVGPDVAGQAETAAEARRDVAGADAGVAEKSAESGGPETDELGAARRRRSARSRASAWLAAVVAAAAAVVAVVVVLGQRDTPPQNTAAAVISASDVTSFGHQDAGWSMTLYLSPSQDKAVIASDNMPDAPKGRDFQAWLVMPDGSMMDAGVMPHTGGTGQRFVLSGAITKAAGVAVTDEPAGGSKQPTSAPVLQMQL
ncbi:anti-sigma factor [Cumulibacter manganitolerans]|uniref:anti-sigma factor n=1 Tax=Cumulibacter manganitolerans TaxID=1884992 RepID=UPI0012980C5C|nr:anti-sigma factor [Cumulibacter manganitolerans]